MMTLDYTWERREELIRRDEREEGRIEGRTEYRKANKLLRSGACVSVKELVEFGIDVDTATDAYEDFLEDA